jgi:hypothetical protein
MINVYLLLDYYIFFLLIGKYVLYYSEKSDFFLRKSPLIN